MIWLHKIVKLSYCWKVPVFAISARFQSTHHMVNSPPVQIQWLANC